MRFLSAILKNDKQYLGKSVSIQLFSVYQIQIQSMTVFFCVYVYRIPHTFLDIQKDGSMFLWLSVIKTMVWFNI